MGYHFSEKQEQFRARAREFVQAEIAPNSAKYEERGELPLDALKKMGEAGLLNIHYPKRFGGQASGFVDIGIATEEMGRGDVSCGLMIAGTNTWGSELPWGRQLQRAFMRGEKMNCGGYTEPNAGSDAAGYRTTAVREGEEYVINGVKRYISFIPGAQAMAVAVKTAPEKGAYGMSLVRVDLDTHRQGIKITPIPELGMVAHMFGNIVFKNVRVPVSNLIASEGKGFYMLEKVWNVMRCLNALNCLGAAQASLEESIEYVKRRKAFGLPIGKYQAVQFRIAEDYTRIEAARFLCYSGLEMADRGLDNRKESAMAKWFGATVSFQAIDNALQNHGSFGYTKLLPIERRWRDVRCFQIANGTVDIMKSIIGRQLLGKEYSSY